MEQLHQIEVESDISEALGQDEDEVHACRDVIDVIPLKTPGDAIGLDLGSHLVKIAMQLKGTA